MSTEDKRQPIARAMRLLNRLLKGGTLSAADGAAVMGVGVARARAIIQEILQAFEPAKPGLGSNVSIRLTGIRIGEPSHEVAIAACFGASLADLFEGSKLQTGMRDGLDYITNASANPAKFKDLERKFIFVRHGGEIALPQNSRALERLAKAVLDQRSVHVTYRRFDGTVSQKKLDPLSIALYDHQVYVVARRCGDDRIGMYRFSRCIDVKGTREPFSFPDRSEFDPRSLFRDSFGVFLGGDGRPEHVVVRLCGKWMNYVKDHRWHESQRCVFKDDVVEVSLDVHICPEVKNWILSLGPEAEVLQPESLRVEIAKLAKELAAVYST